MTFNIQYETKRKEIEQKITTDWLPDAKHCHSKYHNEWNEHDDRLNSDYTLVGYSEAYPQNLAIKNDPKQRVIEVKEYVQVPLSRPIHESTLGEQISTRKRLSLTGRTLKDRGRAKVFKNVVQYIEDTVQLFETVIFPVLDNGNSKGLGWIKVIYNPFAKKLHKRLDVQEVNLRDVLIDPRTRGLFFKSARYLFHRSKYNVKDAKKIFAKYPMFNPEKLGADSDYDTPYKSVEEYNRENCTIYEVQWKEIQNKYVELSEDMEPTEISEDRYLSLAANPMTADRVGVESQDEIYYWGLYNESVGLFHYDINDIQCWTLIPYIDIHSDSRAYPLSGLYFFKKLNDLVSVLSTVTLENAKRSNVPLATMKDEAAYTRWGDQVENAIRNGGVLVGVEKIYYAQALNQNVVMLMDFCLKTIRDISARHKVSMGEMPAEQVAKETVARLQESDRQSLGRKDLMLNYTFTQLTKVLVRYIGLYFREPDFIEIMDMNPKSPSHIPINQTWTEIQYQAHLAEMYNLPLPEDETQEMAFQQAIAKVQKMFEDENDVKNRTGMGYIINDQEYTPYQIDEMITDSGLSEEEFVQSYKLQPETMKFYLVNHLTDDADLNIKYRTESDYKNDPQYKMNLALMLKKMGLKCGLDVLKDMEDPDPEGTYERAMAENQIFGLAQQLVENPEMMKAVQTVLQNMQGGEKAG